MKKSLNPFRTFMSLLVLLTSLNVKAQRGVPAAYAGDYNRMMSNNTMNLAMQQNMRNNFTYGFNYAQNNKYKFTVKLKDGTVKEVKSKIYPDTVKHANYLLFEDKSLPKSDSNRHQKIYANQTLSISRPLFEEKLLTGIATDSCWLFKVVTGKINAYSYLSEIDMVDGFTLVGFQTGDNANIQKLTPEALEPIIKNDEKAYKAFLKKDYYKAIEKFNKDNK
ncbi:MAG: hypothetical protein ACXVA2_03080 [Mucilaginibacter sp.]